MYLPLFHHFTLVLGPVISELSHHGDKHVLEESYGVILHPHVWDNVDVYYVIESLVHRG